MAIDAFIGTWTDQDLIKREEELVNFRSLVIWGQGVTDVGAELISRCTKLKELHLMDTQITDDGLRHIGKLRSLDWLVLDNAKVTSEGLQNLCNLDQLTGLHIVSTSADDDGFSMLLNMPKLNYLEAAGDNLRGGTISIISQLPALTQLRLATPLADDRDFAQLCFARSLRTISYDMPLVSIDAVHELNATLKNCWIEPFRYFKATDKISFLSGHCIDLYTQRQYHHAVDAADSVLKWVPFNPAAHGARALSNFQLGRFAEFRRDMENVRDNAGLFGETQLYTMAAYFLTLDSEESVREVIALAKPEQLLIERLRATCSAQGEEPIEALIQRLETVGRNSSMSQIIKSPTPREIQLVAESGNNYHPRHESVLDEFNRKRQRKLVVPWNW